MPLGARGTLGTYSGSDATLKAPFGKILGELCTGDEAVEHPLTANHDVGRQEGRDRPENIERGGRVGVTHATHSPKKSCRHQERCSGGLSAPWASVGYW
jgi:hypothetical protein